MPPYQQEKQAGPIGPRRKVAAIHRFRVLETMFLARRSTRGTFHRIHVPLRRILEILNWTGNTNSSRISSMRNRSRSTRDSSKSRNRTTGSWLDRMQIKPDSNK
jgi:hypothetical protein